MAARAPQFTPGPWAYRPEEYDDWGTVRGPADEEGRRWRIAMARGGRSSSEEDEVEHRRNGTDPYEANARLIAAAPELYQRLTEAREAIASLDDGALGWGEEPHGMLGKNIYPIKDELLHYIDAALAKARGDQ